LERGEAGDSTIVVIDAARRRVVRMVPLDQRAPFGAIGFSGGLAILLADLAGNTPATVAVVDAQGAMRGTTLAGISAGNVEYGDGRVDTRRPGFALDSSADRAFVVDADFTAAEIQLDSLSVSYHQPSARTLAKFVPGPARVVRSLGNGVLAFSGADHHGEPATPAGLFLVDTRTWTWRMVDPNVASFEVGRGVVVGTANPFEAGARHYAAYGLDGSLRYGVDVPDGQSLVVQGRYGYVCRGRGLLRVLDARTGAVLRRYTSSTLPLCATLLYGRSSRGTGFDLPV
jgi:hypothetical protein